MIRTKAQLQAELTALPDPITRASLSALLQNLIDSAVIQDSGVEYGREIIYKAQGNTNQSIRQDGDAVVYMSNEGALTTEQ